MDRFLLQFKNLLFFLLLLCLEQSSGNPQQRPPPENEPRWSTQRSNFFPGADQDLTLTLPSPHFQTAQNPQNHKFRFPGRFQPIVGPSVPRRLEEPPPDQTKIESRVVHNYYSPMELSRGAGSPVYLPPSTSTVRTTMTTAGRLEEPAVATSTASTPTASTFNLPTPAPAASENREIRFLIHKAGDEEIIKRALYEDSLQTDENVSFLKGPTIKLEQRQKVVLPPKRKTVVYVFIKEPEIETKVEMVEPPETPQDQPQVFIFYQKANPLNKGGKETFFYPKGKSGTAATTSTSRSTVVNVGGASIQAKQGGLSKAASASNQIPLSIEPPPGCLTHFNKN